MLLLMLICLVSAPAMAADEFYIGSGGGADVYRLPKPGAERIGHLDRLTGVRVIQKKRNWWKVRTLHVDPAISGWVHAGAVRKRYTPSAASRTKSSFLAGLSSFFHRSEPNQQQTAVLGVRGLEDEGNAAKGRSNRAGVRWMEGLAVSDADIAAFIDEGRLNP